MAYLRGLWDAISTNETMSLEVCFDDETKNIIETPSFVVANAAPITTALAQGGDEPDVTDGKLDITWLTPQQDSETQFLSLAELVFSNAENKKQSQRIQHKQVKKLVVNLPDKAKYAIDGEIREANKLEISVCAGNLTVLTSQES